MTTPGGSAQPGQPGGPGQPGHGGWPNQGVQPGPGPQPGQAWQPGQTRWPAGPWQGGDTNFGVPQPAPQHLRQDPGHGGAGAPGQVPASRVGAHGRPQEGGGGGCGPRWGRIALVAAAAVVVVAAVVLAAMWLLGGSGGEAVNATEEFFEAIKAQDTDAAVAATCRQAPTLPEQMGKGINQISASLGTFDKVVVSAPSTTTSSTPNQDPAARREAADFELRFANGSVGGHAMLVREDDRWKVCFVDLEPPRVNAS